MPKAPAIVMICIGLLDPPKDDVRSSRDPAYVARLADDIRENGIKHPLRVRRFGDRYEVVTGATRRLASIQAGLLEVPCIIIDGEPSDADLILDRFLENDLNSPMNPLDKARVFQQLMKLNGWSQTELAKALHTSPAEVSKALMVSRNLLPALHDDVLSGAIQVTAAYEIAKAPPELQMELAEKLKKGLLTRDSLAVEVSRMNGKKPKGKPEMVNGKTPGGIVYAIPASMSMEAFFAEMETMFNLAKRMMRDGRQIHSFPFLLD